MRPKFATRIVVLSIILLSSVIFLIVGQYGGVYYDPDEFASMADWAFSRGRQLLVNDKVIYLEHADTDKKRERGLSGRNSLTENRALLFIFSESDYWAFWMNDMKFSIDMIWLDEKYTVVDIKHAVSPQTYPKIFKPAKPALYVLETQAGFAEKNNINVSDKLDIR